MKSRNSCVLTILGYRDGSIEERVFYRQGSLLKYKFLSLIFGSITCFNFLLVDNRIKTSAVTVLVYVIVWLAVVFGITE